MYKVLNIEISGVCNAECPWCVTGNRSTADRPYGKMEADDFIKYIEHMLSENIISFDTQIHLYNWGEPLLHGQTRYIFDYLNSKGLPYHISTNGSRASVPVGLRLDKLAGLIFSTCGFSQKSYKKIHGFDFFAIKDNIKQIIKGYRSVGFKGKVQMAYHTYQFNIEEIQEAYKFCLRNNIEFRPVYAFLNDFNLGLAYLEGTMNNQALTKVSKDLCLFYLDDLYMKLAYGYKCPQFDRLAIDEFGKVLTCCAVPKDHEDYSIGNILDLSFEDIDYLKRGKKVCRRCIDSGFAYWVHNPVSPKFVASKTLYGRIKAIIPNFVKSGIKRIIGVSQ